MSIILDPDPDKLTNPCFLLRRTRGAGHYQAILKPKPEDRGAIVARLPSTSDQTDVNNLRIVIGWLSDYLGGVKIRDFFDDPVVPRKE